jgi:hypothetical protein
LIRFDFDNLTANAQGILFGGDMSKQDVSERFWSKVRKAGDDECWIFTDHKDDCGYGMFCLTPLRRSVRAHRVAYEFTFGEIPPGLCVLHSCDNPPCCNPRHLSLGTRADNNLDRDRKGRHIPFIGQDHPRTKLVDSDVVEIRRLVETGMKHADIGKMFGVKDITVTAIANRRIWKHINDPFHHEPKAKIILTESDVIEIRKLEASGVVHRIIAERFGVGRETVTAIANRKIWKHIP